jgi:gamma-glutamyl phosphate reductase
MDMGQKIRQLAIAVKSASRQLADTPTDEKNRALLAMAAGLRRRAGFLQEKTVSISKRGASAGSRRR